MNMPAWKQRLQLLLQRHAEDKSTGFYALATAAAGESGVPMPHVRFVVHRGFLNEDRTGHQLSGQRADARFSDSNALLTTTDVRSPKAAQLADVANAPVEIAWWINPAKLQFRIRGTAYVLPGRESPLRALFPAARLAPRSADATFDWDAERSRMWRSLGIGTRASFMGTPTSVPLAEAPSTEPPQVTDEVPTSFALLVIDPHEVDVLDLDKNQRVLYRREGEDQTEEWKEIPLVQ